MPQRNARFGRATGCDAMILKAMTFFLIGMAVLAMFGKLRLPGMRGRPPRLSATRRCKACNRPIIGKGPCPCQADRQSGV